MSKKDWKLSDLELLETLGEEINNRTVKIKLGKKKRRKRNRRNRRKRRKGKKGEKGRKRKRKKKKGKN